MKKRILSLLLAALMVLPMMASCQSGGGEEVQTESAEETTAPAPDVVLIGEEVPVYMVVRGDNADKVEVDLAMFLRRYLQGTGVETKVTTDWDKNPVSEYEFVVGDTTRIPADEGLGFTLRDLGADGWFVKVSGSRIYMAGGSPATTRLAVEHFLTQFCGYTGSEETGAPMTALSIPGNYEYVVRQSYPITSLTLGGKSLSEYRMVVTSADIKAKEAAERLQSALYSQSGVWVEIAAKDESWDGPTILLSDRTPATSGHFEVVVENGNLIFSTDVKSGFIRGVTAFLTDAVQGKSGDIALDNYKLDEEIGSYVLYSDYGARGDGKTNDMNAIIAAHRAANSMGVQVRADYGATYYIGAHTESAIIQTDTDWTGASFILDDSKMDDSKRTIYAFKITTAQKSYSIVDQLKGKTITEGQAKLDVTLNGEEKAVLILTDETTRVYIREGVNQNSGFVQQEIIVLDKDGNVDPMTPVIWNWENYTTAKVIPVDEKALTVKGGTFTTIVNQEESRPRFYTTGIGIFRSNTVIDGVEHYVIDEGKESAPYYGFFNTEDCAFVTIKNGVVTPHWTHTNNPTGHGIASQGTYDLCSTRAAYLTYENLIQSNDIMDDTYWGIMASKFCKNITLDGCKFSRFDAHEGVCNATIKNSELGYQGLNAIGFGTLTVENTVIHNTTFIQLRSDYGSTWKGDFVIKNCKWDPGKGKTLTANTYALIGGNHNAFWDYGYDCYMPTTITIDGLHIMDEKNAFGYQGIYLMGNIISAYTSEAYTAKVKQQGARMYSITEKLIVKNFTSDSGKDWKLSVNEYMYKDMEVVKG